MDAQEPAGTSEVRLDRLHPAEVQAAMSRAPVVWVPLGALEAHAVHLPFGTDGFSAQGLVERAARITGGIVLPWSALTIGTLHLAWSFRYDACLVEAVLRQTIEQLGAHGARVVIVHTGHGPLDLAHLIKRVCAEVEDSGRFGPGFRAYGLCYLELNAALGSGLGTDWPVAIDHGSIVETSWLMALEPDLVHLERLPATSDAIDGIYGPNPRTSASAAFGRAQIDGCAALLAERVAQLLNGHRVDPMADLRRFVRDYWPEPLTVTGRAGASGSAELVLANPGPVSRYLTSIDVTIDGESVAPERMRLVNDAPGEADEPREVRTLGPESGFYVRRGQSARLLLPRAVDPGSHRVRLEAGLAGVTSGVSDEDIPFI